MITSVLNLKDTHIVCPSKTTRLLCLKNRKTHSTSSCWYILYNTANTLQLIPLCLLLAQFCTCKHVVYHALQPWQIEMRLCCLVFPWLTTVNTAAHFCASGHAEDSWGHCTGQIIPILIPVRGKRLWSAPNRKQTPWIADSCPWLMILIQFPKPMFFSFWNVSSVLPWPISLIALCWHQRLSGRMGLNGSWAECLTCTRGLENKPDVSH